MRDIVILGFSATIALFLLLMLVKNQWFLLVIFALLGVTTGPIWPMVFGIGASSFREKSGTVGSILYAGGGFGGTIIPVVIGWVSGWAGFYGGFWALVAAAALGLTAIWLVKKF
jgi:fucose permease